MNDICFRCYSSYSICKCAARGYPAPDTYPPQRITPGHKRVAKTAVTSYAASHEYTHVFNEPSEKPTDHKVAIWLLKNINFTPEYIHVTWEWTVVEQW